MGKALQREGTQKGHENRLPCSTGRTKLFQMNRVSNGGKMAGVGLQTDEAKRNFEGRDCSLCVVPGNTLDSGWVMHRGLARSVSQSRTSEECLDGFSGWWLGGRKAVAGTEREGA